MFEARPFAQIELESLAGIRVRLGSLPVEQVSCQHPTRSCRRGGCCGAGDVPFFLPCYRILHARSDSRAELLIQRAHERVQSIAVEIKSDTLRTSFFENVPAYRELIELQEELNG